MDNIHEQEQFERLEELRVAGVRAGGIIIDLQDKGPLHKYLISAREQASRAMEEIAFTNPAHMESIIALQAQIRLYLDACHWAEGIVLQGKEAGEIIREEYQNEQTDTDD